MRPRAERATRLCCALAFCALALAAVPRSTQRLPPPWPIHATDHFEISYQPHDRAALDAVGRRAEDAYGRISRQLAHHFTEKMPVILVEADRDLPRTPEEGRALVVASGAAERHHLVLSVETLEKRAHVLAHELTHQFVFELLPDADRTAPWMAEGLADYMSGVWEPADRAKVRDALARRTVPSIAGFTGAERHWGHAFLDFIAAEYGAHGLRRYLTELRTSPSATDALGRAFNLSVADLDSSFQHYLTIGFHD